MKENKERISIKIGLLNAFKRRRAFFIYALSMVLVLNIVLGMIPVLSLTRASAAETETKVYNILSADDIAEVFSTANQTELDITKTIMNLKNDITVDTQITVGTSVYSIVLLGNGYTVSRGTTNNTPYTGALFVIPKHTNLVLDNVILDGGAEDGIKAAAPLVSVTGTLYMRNGAVLCNNENTSNSNHGGGVALGTAADPGFVNDAVIENCKAVNGGGIYAVDGTITNARITGCKAVYGGGIYAVNGTITDTTVLDCTATGSDAGTKYDALGGGLYVPSTTGASVTLRGRNQLLDNTADSGSVSDAYGGGIYVGGKLLVKDDSATDTITEALYVSGNTASSASTKDANGGGVFVAKGGELNISDAQVTVVGNSKKAVATTTSTQTNNLWLDRDADDSGKDGKITVESGKSIAAGSRIGIANTGVDTNDKTVVASGANDTTANFFVPDAIEGTGTPVVYSGKTFIKSDATVIFSDTLANYRKVTVTNGTLPTGKTAGSGIYYPKGEFYVKDGSQFYINTEADENSVSLITVNGTELPGTQSSPRVPGQIRAESDNNVTSDKAIAIAFENIYTKPELKDSGNKATLNGKFHESAVMTLDVPTTDAKLTAAINAAKGDSEVLFTAAAPIIAPMIVGTGNDSFTIAPNDGDYTLSLNTGATGSESVRLVKFTKKADGDYTTEEEIVKRNNGVVGPISNPETDGNTYYAVFSNKACMIVDGTTKTYYSTLEEACKAVTKDGTEIFLLKNVPLGNTMKIADTNTVKYDKLKISSYNAVGSTEHNVYTIYRDPGSENSINEMFNIPDGKTLILSDVNLDGRDNLEPDSDSTLEPKAPLIVCAGTLSIDKPVCLANNNNTATEDSKLGGGVRLNGGVIAPVDASTPDGENLLTITGCSSAKGGGIYAGLNGAKASSIKSVGINSCSATQDGGGIYAAKGTKLSDVTVQNNSCVGNGGGLFCSDVDMSGYMLISNNTAKNGTSDVIRNTYINGNDSVITIPAALSESSSIGFCSPTTAGSIIAKAGGTTKPDISKNAVCFVPDDGTKSVVYAKNETDKPIKLTDTKTTYYTVEADAGNNGSIYPSGKLRVDGKNGREFTIKPDDEYLIKEVVVSDGVDTPLDVYGSNQVDVTDYVGKYTLKPTKNNTKIKAEFDTIGNDSVTCTGAAAVSGTGTVKLDKSSVAKGADNTVTLTPSSAEYDLTALTIEVMTAEGATEKTIGIDKLGAPDSTDYHYTYTITDIRTDPKVEAKFDKVYIERELKPTESSKVEAKGKYIRTDAVLTAEEINTGDDYAKLVAELKKTANRKEVKTYEIALTSEAAPNVPFRKSINLTFDLGAANSGKKAYIYHLDKKSGKVDISTAKTIDSLGKITSDDLTSLSPFLVAVDTKSGETPSSTKTDPTTKAINTNGGTNGGKTGDDSIPPYIIAIILACSVIVLIIAGVSIKRRRKAEGEDVNGAVRRNNGQK